MTIKILPPQLANQIAAGEVVERPASVVKELVENALDAGATHIDIEIDKGGHKRILIRDNGKGVDKEQLTLALSRHATSKISDIDDLEAINSLGFRGEALASISSVARLTMTSRPASQTEAWSAIAEGLDMGVKVMPAAHPNGTSVEVMDLFFNTPARRKFLRAEKTEFSHIETLIKRIALSRPDVGFVLKHNNKIVKRLRAQKPEIRDLEQKSNRIADVVNKGFIEQASVTSCVYDDIEISVWAKAPQLCASVNPAQYSFVNGRMMRDKLIQHAIRQSYGQQLQSEQLPEYVIFIDLPASDVDVNVHPAKHEVRFHHSRLLHDLLIKTIQDALAEFDNRQEPLGYQSSDSTAEQSIGEPRVSAPAESQAQVQAKPSWIVTSNETRLNSLDKFDYKQPLREREHSTNKGGLNSSDYRTQSLNNNTSVDAIELAPAPQNFPGLTPKVQSQADIEFTPANRQVDHQKLNDAIDKSELSGDGETNSLVSDTNSVVSVVFIQQNAEKQFAYFQLEQTLWLIETEKLFKQSNATESNATETDVTEITATEAKELNSLDMKTRAQKLAKTPLLVPVRLRLSTAEKQWSQQHQQLLVENGFDIKLHQQFLIIKQVPNILRTSAGKSNSGNLSSGDSLPSLFGRLMASSQTQESLVASILNINEHRPNKQDIQARLEVLSKQNHFAKYLADNALELNASKLLDNH